MSKSDTDIHATISISYVQYPEFVTKFSMRVLSFLSAMVLL